MDNHQPDIRRTWVCGFAGLLALVSLGAHAGGFALIEQSVSSMGTAYANGSAGIDDASTLFFNPASMTRLEGKNVAGGVHVVRSDVKFSGKGTYNASNPVLNPSGGPLPIGGTPIQGKSHDDIGLTAPVPHGAYSQQYNDQLWFGLSINGPFGLKTDYSDNWVGRYSTIKSELVTVDINPSVAYKINERISVGAGVSALYADGELTQAIDGGLRTPFPPIGVPPGTAPFNWIPGSNTYDGHAKLTGNDWGYGYNLGLLLEPTEKTRLGIAYRSKVDLKIEGDVQVSDLPPPLNVANGKQNAKLDLTLPYTISISGLQELTPRWTLMADVTRTDWSKLDSLDIKIEDGSQSVTQLQWQDTMRYSLGVTYRHDDSWLFRTGVAFDEGATPNSKLRSARIPDANRTWLALGANYKFDKRLSFDFGYAHLFVDDPNINSTDAYDPTTGQTTGFHRVTGQYDASVDILSAQVNLKFN
jgi:long-chain fatty acid transport protein